MTLTPLRCDRQGHKDQSARWARPAVAVLDVEVLLHAALKQSWGVWGVGVWFSLCPLQGAAGDLNCDSWEPELCWYFSWNSGFR